MKSDSINPVGKLKILCPPYAPAQIHTDASQAVRALQEIYATGTKFLKDRFAAVISGAPVEGLYRAYYPQIRLTTASFAEIDSRLSYGHVVAPGEYSTTVTNPNLFADYLERQIGLLIENHGVPVTTAPSQTPIPLHFAFDENTHVEGAIQDHLEMPLRDVFDAPDIVSTDDKIANGQGSFDPPMALAPFTAQRVDYSLHRLAHYTATSPQHFQNYILFTNYQFYIEEFIGYAKAMLADANSGYTRLVEPGNLFTARGPEAQTAGAPPLRQPQMPAYHLTRDDKCGITMINIGVGPSNAKTITDHVAVLRPHTWLMLGHCAGLRSTQSLGDYVLAHAYVREDNVLDEDLPLWVPVPALAEVQIALEQAVAETTGLSGYGLKKIMRTGTVATIGNRNWELREHTGPMQRLSQSRAIGLDMESGTIAANGFRFRVPYGTLLCVSDKPLHGELKLPGMATEFYKRQVDQHLRIGILALEKLRAMPPERLHSRKLRSFNETAFQ